MRPSHKVAAPGASAEGDGEAGAGGRHDRAEALARRQHDAVDVARLGGGVEGKADGAAEDKPSDDVDFADVVQRAQVTREQARGQMGAFTKIIEREFKHYELPFTKNYNERGEPTYRMSKRQGQLWQEAARGRSS